MSIPFGHSASHAPPPHFFLPGGEIPGSKVQGLAFMGLSGPFVKIRWTSWCYRRETCGILNFKGLTSTP